MKQRTGIFFYPMIAMSIFFIMSCSAPEYIRPTTYVVEKDRIIKRSFDTVWQSTVEWFATHNTPIKNIDKNSGLISTEYSLSIGEAFQYMDCGAGESNFNGKVELVNHTGNFNVLIKKIDDHSTKVSINVFFGCTVNKYRYESLLSTDYVLESSTRTNCTSTGRLEKEVLDYLWTQ
jgi:hypothetical protein